MGIEYLTEAAIRARGSSKSVVLQVHELGVSIRGQTLCGGFINDMVTWPVILKARYNPIIPRIEAVESEVGAAEQLEQALSGGPYQ